MSLNFRNKKQHNYFLYFLIAILSFILGWQLTNIGVLSLSEAKIAIPSEEIESVDILKKDNISDMKLFWTIWDELEKKYVDKEVLENEEMIYGAIRGMVDALQDPYTVFMTPEESENFALSLDGKLEGIGAELTIKKEELTIVTPLRKSPAEKSGLLPGDIVYKIDGKLTTDMNLIHAIMSIRGEKGTTVTLTIIREGLDNPFDVSIVRDTIDIESVTVEKLDNKIVYLSVNQFNDKTNEEFRRAISEMLLKEPRGVIIDLRFNGGGYLDIAVELSSYLLPSDLTVVSIFERGKKEQVLNTNNNVKLLNVPLVVLVNSSSASASEIVAGAIQDHSRGIIIGENTFGKGTVQELENFADGSSLRLTIARWFTPSGRDIDEVGITPDIIVKITDEDRENEFDSQKNAAIEYLLGR